MNGILSGGGQASSPNLVAENLDTYYQDSTPVRSFKQYLDGVDKKKIMSDLLKDQAGKSHQTVQEIAGLESDAISDAPPLPAQSSAAAAQPGMLGSQVRGQVRKGLIDRLVGSYLGGG